MSMYSSHRTNSRSPSSPNAPLTAERAMMDQIRSKLERAKRRLARNSSGSSGTTTSSSSSSRYLSASEYHNVSRRSTVKSVVVEEMPATASKLYAPPPSVATTHKSRPSSTRETISTYPSSTYQSSKYDTISSSRHAQYQSRSKYSQSKFTDTDPFNGGPPPMSTPYLVYSNSKLPMSQQEARPATEKQKTNEEKKRYRQPPSLTYTMMVDPPPSAMRSGLDRPPNSRVRFEGHERDSEMTKRDSETTKRDSEVTKRDSEIERKQRQLQMKEREARHQRQREKELKNTYARAKEMKSSSAATTHGRRSTAIENPPSSAIKLSAYENIVQALPPSPVGRTRRSSISSPPPKSDIQISAFDDVMPRRRSSQSNQPKPENVEVVTTDIQDNQETVERQIVAPTPTIVKKSPQSSMAPESDEPSTMSEDEEGSTSAYETDDSYEYEFSDFDTDSEVKSGYSVLAADGMAVPENSDSEDEDRAQDATFSNLEPENDMMPLSSASELSTVKEEDEEGVRRTSKLTAKDLALHALGRTSTSTLSDTSSPVTSANGKQPMKTTSPAEKNTVAPETNDSAPRSNAPAPMSYTPASSAFPSARALSRRPRSATTSRSSRTTLPTPPTSMAASHVRHSRTRVPLTSKNHLPPTIGALSGLSSGSSTFTINPRYFYDVTWQSGEFAFSVQRVYTNENEYEFDDSNTEPQLFLRMLLDTERSTCESFRHVHVGDVLIRVGDTYVSDLGLEGSGTVLTKFFAKLTAQTPIKLTFQRMSPSDWEGGVEL